MYNSILHLGKATKCWHVQHSTPPARQLHKNCVTYERNTVSSTLKPVLMVKYVQSETASHLFAPTRKSNTPLYKPENHAYKKTHKSKPYPTCSANIQSYKGPPLIAKMRSK